MGDVGGSSQEPAGSLPRSVPVLTAALAAAGVATGLLATAVGDGPRGGSATEAVVLGVALVVAGCLHIDFWHRGELNALDVFEAVLAPVVLVLPGPAVVALAAAAKVVAESVLRVQPAKAAFNVGQWAAAAGTGSLAFAVLRGGGPPVPADVGPLALAMLVVWAVNHSAVAVVLRLVQRARLAQVLAGLAPVVVPGWLVRPSLNVVAGLLVAGAVTWSPRLTVLLPVPLLALHWASRGYAAARADRARLHGLQRATHALAVPVNPLGGIPRFLAEVRDCLGANTVDLVVIGEGGLVRHRLGPGGAYTTGPEAPGSESLAAALIEEGRPAHVRRARGDPVLIERLAGERRRDCLAAPVWHESRIAGVLCSYDHDGFDGFADGQLALLEALAAEVAVALQRAALLGAVLEERTKLADIVKQASDGIATFAPDGAVLSWNPGFERITGFAAAELVGRAGADGPWPGGEPWVAGWVGRDTADLPAEVDIVTRSGVQRWLSCSYTAVGDGGEPRLLILVARDTTEARRLRQAEVALRDSEARFQALVEHSSDLLAVVDAGGRLHYASPALAGVLGPPCVDGHHLLDVVHDEDLDRVRPLLATWAATPGVNEPVEFQVRGIDGVARHVETVANNLLDDPAVAGIVLNGRDITERKRAEAFLVGESKALEHVARDAPLAETLAVIAGIVEHQSPGLCCAVVRNGDDGSVAEVAAGKRVPPAVVDAIVRRPAGARPQLPHRVRAPWSARPVWEWREVPITASEGGRVLGVLAVGHVGAHPSTSVDDDVVERCAHLAGIAMERGAARARLAHQAIHDLLTGLPNRTLLVDRLGHALAQSDRRPSSVAVLFLDLDRFKALNDSRGHDAGDQVLMGVAHRLRSIVRPGDTVARFGGDEFVVLCEGLLGELEAVGIADRLVHALADPFVVGDDEVRLTASVGIAFPRDDAAGPEALLDQADAAMYQAKERGKARFQLFDTAMHARALGRIRTERELRTAMEQDQFRLVYQPQLDLQTGLVVGVEALLRWQHPERGLVAPSEFIDLAEEAGLVVPIGRWVLREACRQAAVWRAMVAQGRPLRVAVNLSARQLAERRLTAVVGDALADAGVGGESLCLEITESVLMEDALDAARTLQMLKSLGVALSVDDFGTGYSSLAYVHRFPIDELKVDRSFVEHLADEADDPPVVGAVISLAHALGLTAVAEGVETADQIRQLRALGCDGAQGYYWSHPVGPEEIDRWLREPA